MSTPLLAALAALFLTVLSLIVSGGPSRPASNTAVASPGIVVHEWGTFTSVVGRDGKSLIWRPLTFESDVPSFVYSVDKGTTWRERNSSRQRYRPRYPSKSYRPVSVRMETPVLYFYSSVETTVRVKVDFPGGEITEWYPQARFAGNRGIDWGEVRVMPGARVGLSHDFRENHYYPARETDAALLQVRNGEQAEHEKFLFYRGVGDSALPLSVRLAENKVAITSSSEEKAEEKVRQAVLFENRGGAIGYSIVNLPEDESVIDRPSLDGSLPELRQEIKAMLIANGLYEKEADAMLNTWRDSWFEEGLRVFYVMPRKTTDQILPIAIEPEPEALVRVLVGRTEIITPEMERNVINQLSRLSGPSIRGRKSARQALNKYGRFLESILTEIASHTTDEQLMRKVDRLLGEMN